MSSSAPTTVESKRHFPRHILSPPSRFTSPLSDPISSHFSSSATPTSTDAVPSSGRSPISYDASLADIVASKTAAIPSCTFAPAVGKKKRGRKPKSSLGGLVLNVDGAGAVPQGGVIGAEEKPAKRGRKSANSLKQRRSQPSKAFDPFLEINRDGFQSERSAFETAATQRNDNENSIWSDRIREDCIVSDVHDNESVFGSGGADSGGLDDAGLLRSGVEALMSSQQSSGIGATQAPPDGVQLHSSSISLGAGAESAKGGAPVARPVRIAEKRPYSRFYNPYCKVYGWLSSARRWKNAQIAIFYCFILF